MSSEMLKDKIKALSTENAGGFIAIRRHLHAHPELSYKEFETSKFVQSKLTEWGIPFSVMAETGVVGIIQGKNPNKRVVAPGIWFNPAQIADTYDLYQEDWIVIR